MSESFLRLAGLTKRFGDTPVLEDLGLEIGEGEILALLGLSGSGKTTALRLVAGFETPDAGRIVVGGEDVTAQVPARRGFGMVFQHYALFPHMSVGRNIAFGIEARGWSKLRVEERVRAMLRLVDLEGYETRPVDAVSGGQQQRVALARALAPEPRVLLLDEPLSNLDPALRERTRRELERAVKAVGITTLLVTHEQEEAFDIGDRVAVLDRGRLAQVGSPKDLYSRPATRFVATFVGRASIMPGRIVRIGGDRTPHAPADVELEGGVQMNGRLAECVDEVGAAVDLVARPEALRLTSPETPGALRGTVAGERFTGPLRYALIVLGSDESSTIEVVVDQPITVAEAVGVTQVEGAPPATVFARREGR